MALTDTAVRNAKPAERPVRLFDEKGLYLEVSPKGGKWWRFKYRIKGKEKRLSLGTYPEVSLKKARDRRDEARKLVADEIDPSVNRKAQKAAQTGQEANSFEVIAREWYTEHSRVLVEKHGERILRRFERDIFPWIGKTPVSEVTAPDLLKVLRRIADRGANETSHRALGNCGQVFRYAIATGRALHDPSGGLKGALPSVKGTHFAATTEPKQFADILRSLSNYEGTLTVRCALRLAPLVFVRPGELRHAKWEDIDLEAAEWRYIVTKTNTPHIVPLSTQALEILHELKPLTGRSQYVFPSARSPKRPMSDNAIVAAMRRIGIGKDEMTAHGFRAAARTIRKPLKIPLS